MGLHEFGWSIASLVPDLSIPVGEDAPPAEQIRRTCDQARRPEFQIRPNLIMMLGFVYMMSQKAPNDMMHHWVLNAMKRHNIQVDDFTDMNLPGALVPPNPDPVQ
jgi:hypothetical protein